MLYYNTIYKSITAPIFYHELVRMVTFSLGALASIIQHFIMYVASCAYLRSFYRLFIFNKSAGNIKNSAGERVFNQLAYVILTLTYEAIYS